VKTHVFLIFQKCVSSEEIEIDIANHKPPTRRNFTSKFKLEVLSYAKVHGNRAAGRHFNVCEGAVRGWRKQEDALRHSKQTIKKMTPPRSTWPDLEAIMKSWIKEQRDWGNVLSMVILRNKAREFAEMLKIEGFCASRMWMKRFIERNNILLKRIEARGRTHKWQ
jgi:transposase-like protein